MSAPCGGTRSVPYLCWLRASLRVVLRGGIVLFGEELFCWALANVVLQALIWWRFKSWAPTNSHFYLGFLNRLGLTDADVNVQQSECHCWLRLTDNRLISRRWTVPTLPTIPVRLTTFFTLAELFDPLLLLILPVLKVSCSPLDKSRVVFHMLAPKSSMDVAQRCSARCRGVHSSGVVGFKFAWFNCSDEVTCRTHRTIERTFISWKRCDSASRGTWQC